MSFAIQRRSVLFVASVCLELLGIGGVLWAVTPPEVVPPGFVWLCVAAGLLALVNWFVHEVAGLDDRQRPRVALGLSVGAMFLVIQASLFSQVGWLTPGRLFELFDSLWTIENRLGLLLLYSMLALGALWYRLLLIDAEGMGIRATMGRFQLGLVLLTAAAFWAAFVGRPLSPVLLIAEVLVGLWALSLARTETVATVYGEALPFTVRTAGVVLAAILGTGLLAVLVGVTLGSVGPTVLRPVLWLLDIALTLITVAVVWLLTPLVWLVQALIASLRRDSSDAYQPPQIVGGPNLQELLADPGATTPLHQAVRVLVIVVFLALAAWLVMRSMQRRWRADATVSTGRESVYQEGQLGQDLSSWARGALNALIAQVRGWQPKRYGTQNVYDLYKNVLQLGVGLGVPRAPETTPAEYLPILIQQLPVGAAEFTLLTEAYIDARYGNREFSESELARLQGAWMQLRTAAPEMAGEPVSQSST